MPIDQTALGQVVSEQMQAIERDYDDGEEHRIGAVITVVEILTPVGGPVLEQGEGEAVNVQMQGFRSDIRARNNVGDPYRTAGLLQIAQQIVLSQIASEG